MIEEVVNPDTKFDVIAGVESLVDKSLLRRLDVPGETRYQMLETIREFAAEQLDEAGEGDIVRSNHADWCLRLGESLLEPMRGWAGLRQLDRVAPERDNFRAALTWLHGIGDCARIIPMTFSVQGLLWVRSERREGLHWLECALESCRDAPTLDLAPLKSLAGRHLANFGNSELGTRLAEEALETQKSGSDQWEIGRAAIVLGVIVSDKGEFERGLALCAEAIEKFRAVGDRYWEAMALQAYASAALGIGDLALARESVRSALETLRGFEPAWSLCRSLHTFAVLALQGIVPRRRQ